VISASVKTHIGAQRAAGGLHENQWILDVLVRRHLLKRDCDLYLTAGIAGRRSYRLCADCFFAELADEAKRERTAPMAHHVASMSTALAAPVAILRSPLRTKSTLTRMICDAAMINAALIGFPICSLTQSSKSTESMI